MRADRTRGCAAANRGDLAAVEGVDVVFVGTMDLSQSLGFPGDTDAPAVTRAVDGALARIVASGRSRALRANRKQRRADSNVACAITTRMSRHSWATPQSPIWKRLLCFDEVGAVPTTRAAAAYREDRTAVAIILRGTVIGMTRSDTLEQTSRGEE